MKINIKEENKKWKLIAQDDDYCYEYGAQICRLTKENFIDFKLRMFNFNGKLEQGKIFFDSSEKAQEAANWIESVHIMNKLLNDNSGLEHYRMQSGNNIVQILSSPQPISIHIVASNGVYKRTICPVYNCPECQNGDIPRTRYEVEILDNNDEFKLLEMPRILVEQLINIINEYGDPSNYYIKIIKDGKGIEVNYRVFKGIGEIKMKLIYTIYCNGICYIGLKNKDCLYDNKDCNKCVYSCDKIWDDERIANELNMTVKKYHSFFKKYTQSYTMDDDGSWSYFLKSEKDAQSLIEDIEAYLILNKLLE